MRAYLSLGEWLPLIDSVRSAEYTSNDVDLVIENLTLETGAFRGFLLPRAENITLTCCDRTANLLPNIFEIESRNYWKLSPYDNLGDTSKHAFWVGFSQVRLRFASSVVLLS